MRPGRRHEVGVDNEVDLQIAVHEPAAASCEVVGPRDVSDAEETLVEGDWLSLTPGRIASCT